MNLHDQCELTITTLRGVARALRAPHLGCHINAEQLEATAANLRAALDDGRASAPSSGEPDR